MKKYIIPATDAVALQVNSNLMVVSYGNEVADPDLYPQLAPSRGWRSENWTDDGDDED